MISPVGSTTPQYSAPAAQPAPAAKPASAGSDSVHISQAALAAAGGDADHDGDSH